MMNAQESITLGAYAKVNLSLYVTGRRDDGYHNIVSMMQGVSLHDSVTVRLAGAVSGRTVIRQAAVDIAGCRIDFTADTDNMPFDMHNLALRGAAALLADDRVRTRVPSLGIHIDKRLPVAAGIAGGSGNAAAVMLALNALTGYPFSLRELMDRGASIGADIPFSLMMNAYRNRTALAALPGIAEASPAAVMRGIGDIVDPVPPLNRYVIMMNPGTSVSTADAYRAIDRLLVPGRNDFPLFYNIFEQYTYDADPEAARLRTAMERHLHAEHTLLSGSGPTTVAYYKDKETAERDYAAALSEGWADPNWKVWYAFSGEGEEI